jgi:hypothetical protein
LSTTTLTNNKARTRSLSLLTRTHTRGACARARCTASHSPSSTSTDCVCCCRRCCCCCWRRSDTAAAAAPVCRIGHGTHRGPLPARWQALCSGAVLHFPVPEPASAHARGPGGDHAGRVRELPCNQGPSSCADWPPGQRARVQPSGVVPWCCFISGARWWFADNRGHLRRSRLERKEKLFVCDHHCLGVVCSSRRRDWAAPNACWSHSHDSKYKEARRKRKRQPHKCSSGSQCTCVPFSNQKVVTQHYSAYIVLVCTCVPVHVYYRGMLCHN